MSLLRQSIRCCLIKKIHQYSLDLQYNNFRLWRFYCSAAISHPAPDGCEKSYSPKILNIAEEIGKLTLIEVVDLNECLKKKLKIKDLPMMMGAAPIAAPAATGDDEGESEPQVTKSSFTVKLASFDPAKKIALIKEVKNLMEGMNLVQAKQFIESSPQVLKADIAKDEAENIKKSLEAVGAVCEIS